MSTIWKIVKDVGQMMAASMGMTALIIGAVSLGVAVAPFIAIPIILTVGLIVGGVTAYIGYRDIQRQNQQAADHQINMQKMQETNTQMMDRMLRVENNVVELKSELNTQARLIVEPKAKIVNAADPNPLPKPPLKPAKTVKPVKPMRSFSAPRVMEGSLKMVDQARQLNQLVELDPQNQTNQNEQILKKPSLLKRSKSKTAAFFNMFRDSFKHKKPANDAQYASGIKRVH